MRSVVLVACMALLACNDVRDFRGRWQGDRVGSAPALRVGPGEAVTLDIDGIDNHGIRARIAIPGLVGETSITSLEGAEADALANLSFPGNPLRVFLAFAPMPTGGDALVLIALYDDERLDVRVLRSGESPLYAIFALQRSP